MHFDESSAQRDRVERAHPDSGKWLTSEDDYKKWKSSAHSSLFLIRGKPGSGKSTLAKHILEGISSHSSTESYVGSTAKQIKHDSLVASFFYSFRGGKEKTSHTMMLQSLLYQLLSQEERLFPLFQKIYRAKRSASKIEWQKEDLEKVFAALPSLKTQQTIYIFLDAMDESAEEGRPEILKILQNICATDSNCTFKCLIASRPLPDGQIDESAHYGIILQDKNRGDIEKLITSGLQHITKLAGGGAVDFELAYEHMVNNAHGVFLWVSLVLKELEKVAASGASQEEVDFCLRNLPLDLEEMYERIIQRLKHQPQSMIDQAVKMLTWVTFAGRPLSIEELHDAVVIPTHPKPFNPHSRFLERAKIHGFEKRLQVCCGPLLEVRQSAVQLLHQTIREHLLREDRRATPFDTDEGRGDTEIAFGCIRYLSLLCLPSFTEPAVTWSSRAYDEFVKWLTGYPLLLYVVYFLSRHLKSLAGDSTVLNELLGLFKDFQKQDASFCLFEGWMRTLGRSETSFPPSMNPGQFRAKCLIAAVKNGHEGVSRSVLALQTDINAIDEDSGNSALHMAVDTKSKSMVELLLSMNANINLKNRKSQTPFSRAAELGLEGIALLLLETNTYGNRAIAQLGNAMAASLGHEALAKLLLDSGADVNARDGEHGNALEAAVSGGHPGIVELLLDSDADFNAQGRKYETALLAVRQRGHQRISQMLLDATADPNL